MYRGGQVDRDRVRPLAAKLMRALTQTKGRRDHWASTQENMFCSRAVIDYARNQQLTLRSERGGVPARGAA